MLRKDLEKIKQVKEEALKDWFPRKTQMAKDFIDEESKQQKRNFDIGAVHLCELGVNIGSEQGEERPVVILSNNRINSSSTNVMIVPLTKNLKKRRIKTKKGIIKNAPKIRTHYFLMKDKYPFLSYNSAAMTEGITTISKIRIGKHMGKLSDQDLTAIQSRLKWIFDLQ
ncbi:type II toxin-antitoxin system PemK/MazF family toxin [Lentibacillus cibarius]|nr:type II toxin-antitoxin system PemK/MazF family toxin [Lentibacillus cibarius]